MAGGYGSEDYTIIKYSPLGDSLWVRRLDGTGGGTDEANALAIDSDGNTCVTGASWGSGSGFDYLTVKVGPSGDTLWTRRYNGPHNGADVAHAIAVDAAGNVYVTGESEGLIGIHGIFEDFATVKYSPDGDLQWVARYNGPGGDYDRAASVSVDGSGNVYVTGTSDGGSGGSGAPYFDFATIKYDASGVLQWVERYNGPGSGDDQAAAVAVDAAGSVYVTGSAWDDLSGSDITTIRYAPDGEVEWIAVFDGPGSDTDEAAALLLGDSGNLFVAGKAYRGASEGYDVVTVRYEETGDTAWVRFYDGLASGDDGAVALATSDGSGVFVTGNSEGGMTGQDFTTLKYSLSGDLEWEMRYTNSGASGSDDLPSAIAVDGSGSVWVTGMSALDFATVQYEEGTTGVRTAEPGTPGGFSLFQNYPNPFNPSTKIRYQIPSRGFCELRLFDTAGRQVTMIAAEVRDAGVHEITLDVPSLASGTYFYTLVFALEGGRKSLVQSRALVIIK
jgi:hypothetical protein